MPQEWVVQRTDGLRSILLSSKERRLDMKPMYIILLTAIMIITSIGTSHSQPVPSTEENIPFLVTFGKNARKTWGDNDFCQIFFFVIPTTQNEPIYIRIFDPDVGGKFDEERTNFNTSVSFSIYGGKGIHSEKDFENKGPNGYYNRGNLLSSKVFKNNPHFDGSWYTFGPINPAEGELIPELGGYVIKVIAEGLEGDDGNLYKYFMSTKPDANAAVEGGNAFTYEYTFRLHSSSGIISHIYPFVEKNVVAIMQNNFDFDRDCYIRIVSVSKKGTKVEMSGEGNWASSHHDITADEKNTSLDIQMIKTGTKRNNNVVFYLTNQYGEYLPFYTLPIGGVPKYMYSIGVRKTKAK